MNFNWQLTHITTLNTLQATAVCSFPQHIHYCSDTWWCIGMVIHLTQICYSHARHVHWLLRGGALWVFSG